MNILKVYNNDYLSTDDFLNKTNEIDQIGYLENYINDDILCMHLKNHYYHGNDYIKDLIKLIKKNSSLKAIVKNITINDVINDNNENGITIKLSDKTIVINLKDKKVDGIGKETMQYSNNYILKPIDKPENLNSIIKKVDLLGSYINMNDPATKSIITCSWSDDDVTLFKSKIINIINKIPQIYKEEFKNSRLFTDENTKTAIDDFTLIGATNKKLHCILNKKTNLFECHID